MFSPDDTTAERLDTAAEVNLVTHVSWVQQRTPGMRVYEDEQLTVVDSGLATDTFNFVGRARLANDSLRERINRVATHFNTVQRPFSWWVGALDRPLDLGQSLLEAGFEAAESEVTMAANLNALKMTDLAPYGLRIERGATAKQIHDFATINAANWLPPDQAVIRFYEAALLLSLPPKLRYGCMWVILARSPCRQQNSR